MKARKAASNRQDAPARASKVASRLVASKVISEVDKTRTIWKTTISAPAMHRAADRDAAARIANSYTLFFSALSTDVMRRAHFFTRDGLCTRSHEVILLCATSVFSVSL